MVAATPFGTPLLIVADTLRVCCVVLGVFNALLLLRIGANVARRAILLPTKWGPPAMAFLTVSAIFTEIGRIGTGLTWRLPVNLAGVLLGVGYSWHLLYLYPKERWPGAVGKDPWSS